MSAPESENGSRYMLICQQCAPPLPMPFTTAKERGEWATKHKAATGHATWTVWDTRPQADEVESLVQKLNASGRVKIETRWGVRWTEETENDPDEWCKTERSARSLHETYRSKTVLIRQLVAYLPMEVIS